MQSQFTRFFNRYDLFGKSVPGAVFIGGFYFLLPMKLGLNIGQPRSLLGLLGQVFIFLVFGLLIGEAIHSLARIIEGLIIKVGLPVTNKLRRIKVRLDGIGSLLDVQVYKLRKKRRGKNKNGGNESRGGAGDGRTGRGGNGNFKQNIIRKFNKVFVRSFIFVIFIIIEIAFRFLSLIIRLPGRAGSTLFLLFHPIFQRHRILFLQWIKSNYAGPSGHWDPGKGGALSVEFKDICSREFNIELEREMPEESFYTLITTKVAAGGSGLSQRFQDLYSFSRSMWTVLLILLIWYAIVFITEIYSPWWYGQKIPNNIVFIIFFLGTVLFGLFLVTAGRYKKLYINYLISDFIYAESRES